MFLTEHLTVIDGIFKDLPVSADSASKTRLFMPETDKESKEYDKVQSLRVLKRIIFKLATALERINYFHTGSIRARSITLEALSVDLHDVYPLAADQNLFEEVRDRFVPD